jgi:hypothetical protein
MFPDGDRNSPPWAVCIGMSAALVVDFTPGTDALGEPGPGVLLALDA